MPKSRSTRPKACPGSVRLLTAGIDFDRKGQKDTLGELIRREGFYPMARIVDRMPISRWMLRRLSRDPEAGRFFFSLHTETNRKAIVVYVNLRDLTVYFNLMKGEQL